MEPLEFVTAEMMARRAQAQHTGGAEHLAHHNADGGADDELGDQQHTAPLDNAAHVPDPQRGAQAEQLDTDGGVAGRHW